jgi:DNA-binding transcriptional MocR family regulator
MILSGICDTKVAHNPPEGTRPGWQGHLRQHIFENPDARLRWGSWWPRSDYNALVNFKRVNDLATSTLVQRALEAYVTVGRYQSHLRRSCQIFRKRRDVMLSAIQRYLPVDIHLDPPQGGLFLWLQLPKRCHRKSCSLWRTKKA